MRKKRHSQFSYYAFVYKEVKEKKKKIATEIAWGRVRIRKNKRHKWNNTQINHIILTTTNHVTQ